MENNQVEMTALKNVVTGANESEVRELEDLQLAMVGGGVGEVTLS